MTPQQELSAGRASDALIAEKVMGWTRSLASNFPWQLSPPTDASVVLLVPAYSTDIRAAWLVVERMSARGFWCVVKSPFLAGEPYHAGFTPHGTSGFNGRADYRGSGDTAALAICRAALAVGDGNAPLSLD